MHLLSNQRKEVYITDYVGRETALTRMRIQDTEKAIMQEQDDIRNA